MLVFFSSLFFLVSLAYRKCASFTAKMLPIFTPFLRLIPTKLEVFLDGSLSFIYLSLHTASISIQQHNIVRRACSLCYILLHVL